MRFVVTGCARSGTLYTAKVLARAGADCGHEHVFTGSRAHHAATRRAGDVSCFAAPHLPVDGAVVVHLVRPPLDVIASIVGKGMLDGRNRTFAAHVAAHTPDVFDYPPDAQRAAAYWLAWNTLAARHARLLWRLHALTAADVMALSRLTGLDLDEQRATRALAQVPTAVNAHPAARAVVTLDDLGPLAVPVARAANAYGLPLTHTPRKAAPMAEKPRVDRFRNKLTGHEHSANPNTPAHARMVANPGEFERVEPEPRRSKSTRRKPAAPGDVEQTEQEES